MAQNPFGPPFNSRNPFELPWPDDMRMVEEQIVPLQEHLNRIDIAVRNRPVTLATYRWEGHHAAVSRVQVGSGPTAWQFYAEHAMPWVVEYALREWQQQVETALILMGVGQTEEHSEIRFFAAITNIVRGMRPPVLVGEWWNPDWPQHWLLHHPHTLRLLMVEQWTLREHARIHRDIAREEQEAYLAMRERVYMKPFVYKGKGKRK